MEVVLSLGLLVAAMAMIGFQINTSLSMANATDLRTRALLLVDTKMAELDAGVLNPSWASDDLKGYFGVAYPGYSWRMRVKPAEIPNLYLVWLDIGYNPDQVNMQVENPDLEIHIDDPGTQILRTVYRLVPKPADVNVQRDFGLSQEELDAMVAAASIAGDANTGMGSELQGALDGAGGGGGANGGGAAGGGAAGGTNSTDVMKMLTKLIQAVVSGGLDPNNIQPRDLAQYLDDETLEALGPFIDAYFGNGPNAGQLPGPLDNLLGSGLLGGGRGNRGGNRGNNANAPQGQGQDQGQGPGAGQGQGPGGGRPGQGGQGGGGRDAQNPGGTGGGPGTGRGPRNSPNRDGGNSTGNNNAGNRGQRNPRNPNSNTGGGSRRPSSDRNSNSNSGSRNNNDRGTGSNSNNGTPSK